MDESIKITNLRDRPELIPEAAAWFSAKWEIPAEEYETSMRESAECTAKLILYTQGVEMGQDIIILGT